MRLKTAAVFLSLLVVLVADAGAQKWEFTAFGGYRWGGELDDGDFESAEGILKFEDGPCWGLRAGYNINPRFQIQLMYDRQHTSFRFEYERVGADTTLADGKLDYLMAGVSINLLDEDYKLMPYFALYLGATQVVPDNSSSDSNWFAAVGYALGVKYFFTENLGAMVENRGTSTILTDSATLVCSDTDQCVTLPADTWMWQIGLSLGVVVTF